MGSNRNGWNIPDIDNCHDQQSNSSGTDGEESHSDFGSIRNELYGIISHDRFWYRYAEGEELGAITLCHLERSWIWNWICYIADEGGDDSGFCYITGYYVLLVPLEGNNLLYEA